MNDGAGVITEKQAFDSGLDQDKLPDTSSSTPSTSDARIPTAPATNGAPQSEKLPAIEPQNEKKPKRRLFASKKDKKGKEVAVEEEQDPLAHLPQHEQEILRAQLIIPPVNVGYKTLFRYATRNDILLMCLGAICAIAGGVRFDHTPPRGVHRETNISIGSQPSDDRSFW